MTRKTKKDLEEEVSKVKQEFKELKLNYDTLSKKYESLCKTPEDVMKKCEKCNKEFASEKHLRMHIKTHKATSSNFTCTECEKTFDGEWKLNAHRKTHKNYPCDQCEKSYKTEELKEKHKRISHEELKLFCHFYNNDKNCPHAVECIFLHEVSGICKYGALCERNYCMYKHDIEDIVNGEHCQVNLV